jgi:uncharacterized protein (DUF2336 family)
MRMVARIEEVEPGVFEAGYTMERSQSVTVSTEDDSARFDSEAAARAWIERVAADHEIPTEAIWREDLISN